MTDNIVEIKNLTVSRKDTQVLKNVNYYLKKGDFNYITGAVGSGKSTFLKILYADLKIESGTVNVAGYNLNSLDSDKIPFLRRKLGIIFQDFMLLSDRNIFDNLKIVLDIMGQTSKKYIKTRIFDVLAKVKLTGKEYNMPYELSGGEQQRAAIARAILSEPLLIIADEPTGNLDPESSANFMKILFEVTKIGTSVIMATHDQNLIEKFPAKVFEINNSTLKEL